MPRARSSSRREAGRRHAEPSAKPRGEHHRFVIVGTGFAGLGAAITLIEGGETDLVILERASDVGGCWRDNTYPGIQCDIQSLVYSFSFDPNPHWSRAFPIGAEIHQYLRDVTERHGLRPYIRFDTELRDARWDDAAGLWQVETSAGPRTAEFLVSAHGALSAPATPAIPGLDRFRGPVFHSARWRHDVSLEGKRVAVVGTGASAIQIIPSIQPSVASLTVYQRTPAWVLPRPDGPVSLARQLLFEAVPAAARFARAWRFLTLEARIVGILTRPELLKLAELRALAWLRSQVPDPDLREALTPRYAMGCKRILLSNDYYPAMCADNVRLSPGAVHEVTETGVVGADGRHEEADVIVLCTGFRVADHPLTHHIHGRDGRTVAEANHGGAGAYLGMTVPGFPNLFLLLTGPHTGLGHNSIVFMIEAQLRYLAGAVRAARERGGPIEVREDVTREFMAEMARKLEGTVWSSGCTSFYLDSDGRNIAIWPGFAATYALRTRRFEPAAFLFGRATGGAEAAA